MVNSSVTKYITKLLFFYMEISTNQLHRPTSNFKNKNKRKEKETLQMLSTSFQNCSNLQLLRYQLRTKGTKEAMKIIAKDHKMLWFLSMILPSLPDVIGS